MQISINDEQIVNSIADQSDHDSIVTIMSVDETKGDWEFTERLAKAVTRSLVKCVNDGSEHSWHDFVKFVNALDVGVEASKCAAKNYKAQFESECG